MFDLIYIRPTDMAKKGTKETSYYQGQLAIITILPPKGYILQSAGISFILYTQVYSEYSGRRHNQKERFNKMLPNDQKNMGEL